MITHELIPLTLPQQRFVDALESSPKLRASFSMSVSLTGPLDVAALLTSLHHLVLRRDALRLAMRRTPAGSWGQWFREAPPLSEVTTCQAVHAPSDDKFSRYVVKLATRDAATPWRLDEEYPFRFRLIRRSQGDHVLLLTFAKQAVDGALYLLLPGDLWSVYHALLAGEPAPGEPGNGFAEALRRREAGGSPDPAEFWRSRLARARPCRFPAPAAPVAPTTSAAPAAADGEPGPRTFRFSLVGEEAQVLRGAVRRARCSELQLVQAALAEAVFERVPDDTLAITLPVDTRRSYERGVLGQFGVNLPLVLTRPASGAGMVAQVRHEWLQVLRNRHVTSRTVRRLAPSSTGWLGADEANNLRLNYLPHTPVAPVGTRGDGALCVAYGRYPPRVLRESAAVHLRVGSAPDRLDFTLSCAARGGPDEAGVALAASLERLMRRHAEGCR
ncbi:condensation domain-containing protein [Streptomyces sp. 184]|uniref:condensation domain-containing protein n=1 Tax=Streptomyces sp. 184 TaxID=1827526 RepID=UPI0038912333